MVGNFLANSERLIRHAKINQEKKNNNWNNLPTHNIFGI